MKTAFFHGRMRLLTTLLLVGAVFSPPATAEKGGDRLMQAVGGELRTEDNVRRDAYRFPYETLKFFGLKEDQVVVESWPGGGWYTEILAPYLNERGTYIAAVYDRGIKEGFPARINKNFAEKFTSQQEKWGRMRVVDLRDAKSKLARRGSVDLILDFRNAHNWLRVSGDAVPRAWHKALKKGGVVGIVDHRLDKEQTYHERSGYVHEAQIIEVMEGAGFTLVDSSEHLANPRDTSDYPQGVWTLPPTLRLGEEDRNRYLAIGESDRMALKFQKK